MREVGPDRAAAEWIVRCGGKVRFVNGVFNYNSFCFRFDKFKDKFEDYNTLIRVTAELDPAKPSGQVSIVEIDASNSCVSAFGCRHFGRLVLTFLIVSFVFRKFKKAGQCDLFEVQESS